MATDIRIIGWKSIGLRSPDQTFEFINNNSIYPVTLIQMPNGTGKTTTLELLRACLSGSAEDWDKEHVRSFRKLHSDVDQGEFVAFLMHNQKRLTLGIQFDFFQGSVKYFVTGPSGKKIGFMPPADLRAFFQPSFVRFFIFDGELAEQLLDRKHTDAEVALISLYQIDVLKSIGLRVQNWWNEIASTKSAKETKGFTRRKNRVNRLKKLVEKRSTKKKGLEEKLSGIKEEIKSHSKLIDERVQRQESEAKKKQKLEEQIAVHSSQISEYKTEIIRMIRVPTSVLPAFLYTLSGLKDSLDRVKLPETAAREFFEEIAEEDECICGRQLDDVTRKAIRDRANNYLASDESGLLNALKHDIGKLLLDKNLESSGNDFLEKIESLEAEHKYLKEAETEKDRFIQAIASEDPEITAAREQIEQLKESLRMLNAELEKYDDPDDTQNDENTMGLVVLQDRYEKAKEQLAEVTDTLKLKRKIEILTEVLENAESDAINRITKRMVNEANQRIGDLLPDNNLRISDIDKRLVLERREGASAGETLSVGYAFLSTLFDRSEHQLPFVVDSPAGPIDLAVRPRIGRLLPKLAKQVIAFTISSERDQFVESLERATEGEVQYLTAFKKGNAFLEGQARGTGSYWESDDGIMVREKSYFFSFQQDEENGYSNKMEKNHGV